MEEKNSSGNNEGYSCPICLGGDHEDDVVVIGPCRHEFCLPCVKRVLSAPNPRETRQQGLVPAENAHLNVPTLGQCPICRSELSLFEMKEKRKGANVISKDHNIDQSDLAGKVFVKDRAKVGNESFHFPPHQDNDDGSLPFLNLSENQWRFDDGTLVPDKILFDEGCHFHDQTRTFHGSISWYKDDCQKRIRGSHRWDYILAFSSDYRFIARGVLIASKQICRNNDCSKLKCKFPMDGRWKVEYPDSEQKPDTTVDVHGNQFQFQSRSSIFEDSNHLTHRIDFGGEHPTILWGEREEKQSASTSGKLLRDSSSSEVVEWDAKSNLGPLPRDRMAWKRETVTSESVPLQVVQFGPGNVYQRLSPNSPSGTVAPEYVPDKIWGNTFGQGLSVGLASYHFMSDASGAYISYEHEDTAIWPPLDNGSPVPTRMWFSDYTFDAESRIFRGHINWEGTHSTTWQGSSRWR
jgi:hypothetical protein